MSINFDEIVEIVLRLDKLFFEWTIIYLNPRWLTNFCIEFVKIRYLVLPIIIGLLIYFRKNQRACLILLFHIVLLMSFSELFVASLKTFFGRLRPGVATGLYLKIDAYSFPSAHAWNSMALFVFFGLWLNRFKYLFIALGIFVGVARFLSNNHFFLDIFFGWLGGGLWGYLFFRVTNYMQDRLRKCESGK